MEKIYFSKVNANAKIPNKRTEDAGYDIYACFEETHMLLKPHETRLIPTGIASAFSEDYYFQIFDRGGTGSKGITCFAGVIDSGFRGEWFIAWHNANEHPVIIAKDKDNLDINLPSNTLFYPYDKAIAQAIFLPVPKTNIEEVSYDLLKRFSSERGEDMLGSTDDKANTKQETEHTKTETNPFEKYKEKISNDLNRVYEGLKTGRPVTINFISSIDLPDFGEIIKQNLSIDINKEGSEAINLFKIGKEYPITEVNLEDKTITFQSEKIYGLFPCAFTLKYNPEIIHINL